MTSLILDTTGNQAFIGLAENGILLSKTVLSEGRQLSKFLLPSIHSILQARAPNFNLGKVLGTQQKAPSTVPRFIAIGTGPGSFTGSRVGGMVGKTLSYSWNIPLIAFSSTLLPDLDKIAFLTYEKYLSGEISSQIELVYISPTS
jgi:tRNA threonylcarbamoyladenosine biosynthesis protein TsaB